MRLISLAQIAIVAALIGFAIPEVAAKEAVSSGEIEVTDARLREAIEEAEKRGRMLYDYDQAAWHATDALADRLDISAIESPRGYIVLPRPEADLLDVVFIVEREATLREFARFTVQGSSVVDGGPIPGELPPLSELGRAIFAAREPALAEMEKQEFFLCSESNPNTLTLPPGPDGVMSFYLLTSTLHSEHYPIGGHYRVDVNLDREVVATMRYMNSCLDLATGYSEGPNENASLAGVTYLLGDTPSEIHVMASWQFSNGFMVITPSNRSLWLVREGEIQLRHIEVELPE